MSLDYFSLIFLRYEKEILSVVNVVDELKLLKNLLSNSDIPLVYCHNDLLVKNIIYNKKEGKYIVSKLSLIPQSVHAVILDYYRQSGKSVNEEDCISPFPFPLWGTRKSSILQGIFRLGCGLILFCFYCFCCFVFIACTNLLSSVL